LGAGLWAWHAAPPNRLMSLKYTRPTLLRYTPSRSTRRAPDALHRTGREWSEAESKSVPRHGYLIIHGVDDDIVPIALAREARSELEARGALVEYHEYPGGHKISAQGLTDITQWIKRILG
jgi:predicted esterase